MLLRTSRVLFALGVIALAVVLGGGTVRLGGIFVMFRSLVVFVSSHKRRIVEETARRGASLSEVARSYGIAARVLFRWKLELTEAALLFVAVEITDAILPTEEHAS
jgi:Transposase